MTQQEQQLISGLIDRVNSTGLQNKDADAENLIHSSLAQNPNALYILCQTVLVQQFAMDNTQRQLTAARAELDQLKQGKQPEQHGSFLGNLFGLGKHEDDRPQAPVAQAANPGYGGQNAGYSPVNNMGTPQYPQQPASYPPPQPGYGAPMGGGMFGGGGGFLQGAAQTAAGVVAGEFAFRALENVFSGFGGGEGRGFGGATEVVNNYYGDDTGDRGSDSFGDRLAGADGLGNGISPDIEDRRGDSQGFLGQADDGGGNFSSGDDDGDFDNGLGGGDDSDYTDAGGNDDNSF